MTVPEITVAAAIGLVAGVLSGLFGVGGGIVMTPGVHVLLGVPPIVALATPLPVILPTALSGALAYRRRGELDGRVAGWLIVAGVPAAALGAWVTDLVDTEVLLLVTALLLASQAVSILRDAGRPAREPKAGQAPILVGIGAGAGFLSGLLGIGGGIVIVPVLAGWLGMPLRRALGTSLLAIVALVVPGIVVHAALGHLDVPIALALALGAVPGARLGAAAALGAEEHTLRLLVGAGLLAVSIGYAADQALTMLG
ncbi:MAG TPA: sulfite exporter TauE/SafE family protein [Actinomycetota bacterium]|nr:sulfite exporter TauE/SafE family protein [Actinomycetota bacterium]